MRLPIRKGPDFTPSQWIVAFAGFLISIGLSHVLVAQGYLLRNWAAILIIIGFGAPPAILGWWNARERGVQ